MIKLEEACRDYALAVWRYEILGTTETESDVEYALDKLRKLCEETYPMPENMPGY